MERRIRWRSKRVRKWGGVGNIWKPNHNYTLQILTNVLDYIIIRFGGRFLIKLN